MGCLIGGYLARAGEEVWLFSRSDDHVEALTRNGLRLTYRDHTHTIAVKATTRPPRTPMSHATVSAAVATVPLRITTSKAAITLFPILVRSSVYLSICSSRCPRYSRQPPMSWWPAGKVCRPSRPVNQPCPGQAH